MNFDFENFDFSICFLNKTKNRFSKNLKIRKQRKNPESWNFEIVRKNIFCFVQKQCHVEKNKIFKIKIYFCKLTILNLYVSNLQLPTPSKSLLRKVNVSEFLDFPQSHVLPSSPSYDEPIHKT